MQDSPCFPVPAGRQPKLVAVVGQQTWPDGQLHGSSLHGDADVDFELEHANAAPSASSAAARTVARAARGTPRAGRVFSDEAFA
jgi:hypothetical protein